MSPEAHVLKAGPHPLAHERGGACPRPSGHGHALEGTVVLSFLFLSVFHPGHEVSSRAGLPLPTRWLPPHVSRMTGLSDRGLKLPTSGPHGPVLSMSVTPGLGDRELAITVGTGAHIPGPQAFKYKQEPGSREESGDSHT